MDEPKARPLQFQVKHLLGLTLWVAVFCQCAVYLGGGVAMLFLLVTLLIVAAVVPRVSRFCLMLAGLMWLTAPGFMSIWNSGRPISSYRRCMINLKQIGVALYNYHDVYGCFPPAYVADESGKPMHGWRVLILPYLEQEALYEQYDFDEPWDGPNNSKLAGLCPAVFRCPEQPGNSFAGRTQTSYVAVVGPGAAWPGSRSARLKDIADGPSGTIMVVEMANSGINWMEPRDLNAVAMPFVVNPVAGRGISSKHEGGANVLFGDGSVHLLPTRLSWKTLDALLTRDGREKVDTSEF